MIRFRAYLLLIAIVFLANSVRLYAQNSHSDTAITKISADWFYREHDLLFQDIYFISAGVTKVNLKLLLYKLSPEGDSISVYSITGKAFEVNQGVNRISLPFKDRRVKALLKEDWLQAYKSIGRVPVGDYSCMVEIENSVNQRQYAERILLKSDTLITEYNSINSGISKILGSSSVKVKKAFYNKHALLERYYKKKGITCNTKSDSGNVILDLYYGQWMLGRRVLPEEASTDQIAQIQEGLKNDISVAGKNQLSSYQSLLSQFRELQNTGKENTELNADISLSGNFSNGQEPNSDQPNNYYEGRIDVDMPLFDVPIQVSGFYTTQDMHRQAKASYIHFRYDAEKAKQQLMTLLSGFNNKYTQSLSQGSAYDMIYGQFLDKLQKEKDKELTRLKNEYGVDSIGLYGFDEGKFQQLITEKAKAAEDRLTDSLLNRADSSGLATRFTDNKDRAMAAKESAQKKYQQAMAQYQKIRTLEQKIEKYETLLDQYKKANFYDSAMAYGKIKDLKDYENMSYKDMAKKASSLLPESKTKSAITGLVNFDAGMFPKYVSDYTMSGQMMKGLDMSYDIGFATIGGSYGRMEYIDRNGNVEGYKAYSGRVEFKPVHKQQIGFVYYGYTPGKDMLSSDGFFKDISVSMPSFRNPVSILSTTYKGEIGKNLILGGEYAFSNKPGQSEEAREQLSFMEQSAYNIKTTAIIPKTTIEVEAGYEHAGKAFENNTLPTLLAGTDRLLLKGKGDFFRSFLTLGAEYNYLVQRSFYSKGSNSKWGFDIATHSKRYPSLALSYKPFSTFRSYNDTLNIAQKPISGEVWTGKANYQIKRLDKAVRFSLLYSRNSSTNDTIRYKSSTAQICTILSRKTTMLMVNIGHSNIDAGDYETAYPIYNNSWFMSNTLSGMIGAAIQLSGGIDLTKAGPGISKYGCFLSSGYHFKKLPLSVSGNFRYNNFRMAQLSDRQQLLSGGIELSWHIKETIYTD